LEIIKIFNPGKDLDYINKECDKLFNAIDTNGDGEIQIEELLI